MTDPIVIAPTLEPGPAAVFLDVENLFKPFRRGIEFDPGRHSPRRKRQFNIGVEKARAAAQTMAPDEEYEKVYDLGPQVAIRLVEWFRHKKFLIAENHGRTYGQFYDEGVTSVWKTFVEKANWNHTLTRKGDDRADRALLTDLLMFTETNPDLDWIFVGSSDLRLILRNSGKALRERPDMYLAAILLGRTETTDAAFRNQHDGDFSRFNTRLYIWKMYQEVLAIEKSWHAKPSDRTVRNEAMRARARHEQRIHDERKAEVLDWASLNDDGLLAAIREALGSTARATTLSHLSGRYLDAADEVSEETARRRVLDAIGRAYQERLEVLTPEEAA